MKTHRYIFENGSKKHLCPECNKKRFVRYIDTKTGNLLPHHYGRCDRESKCSYHLNPYTDGYTKMIWEQEQGKNVGAFNPNVTLTFPKKRCNIRVTFLKPVFIPIDVLKQTLSGYEKNVFIQNLLSRVAFPFRIDEVEKVISLYRLGTVKNGYRTGANTFPFIDIQNNVRAIQVKQFDETNHTIGTDFLHSIIEKHHTRKKKPLPKWLEAYQKNETKVSCLFGEHLLSKYPYNPIALVEAPKTAIYGTLYFGTPEHPTNLLWLAVYNLSSLNLNKCTALKGRNVYLFPDLSKDGKAFELWSRKAKEIQDQLQGATFTVSNLLEQLAPEQDKEQGKDIADYLIKQDWRSFRKPIKKEFLATIKQAVSEKRVKSERLKTNVFFSENVEFQKVENLDKEIAELESYFSNIKLPTKPTRLNQYGTITNTAFFIKSHLDTIKNYNKSKIFYPYFKRLQKLKQHLTAC